MRKAFFILAALILASAPLVYALYLHWDFFSIAVSQNIASLTTFERVIALAALVGTALQAHAARTQNKRMVQPLLCAGYTEHLKKTELSVELQNSGLGPAIIKKYALRYQGRNYEGGGIFKLLDRVIRDEWGLEWRAHIYLPGGTIAAGESKTVIRLFFKEPDNYPEPYQTMLTSAFSIEIKFKSLHGVEDTYSTANHRWAVEYLNKDTE